MIEFCHNVQPYNQPSPARNEGGDCFACALTAVIRHFYPERPVDFNQVWDYFKTNYAGETEKRALQNTWSGMDRAICAANGDGFKFEHRADYVYPKVDTEHWSHGWGLQQSDQECGYRLEAWLKAGWIVLTEIQYSPNGRHGWRQDGYRQMNDHFIIIDGVKIGWENKTYGTGAESFRAGSLKVYAHVVCSAKGGYWMDYEELLVSYGVGAWLLVRRDNREYL